MSYKILLLYIVINSCFIFTYCLNDINIKSTNISDDFIYTYKNEDITTKTQVLNSDIDIGLSYYCKHDTCVLIDDWTIKPYIEFPDENGNPQKYIFYARTYNDIELHKFYDKKCLGDICASPKCNNNSQCFSNRCLIPSQNPNTQHSSKMSAEAYNSTINENNLLESSEEGYCIFNEEAELTHCTAIYDRPLFFLPKQVYTHCGKLKYDSCTKNAECSFKYCYEGKCGNNTNYPTDGTNLTQFFEVIGCFIVIVFITITGCLCYCRRNKKYII